LGAAVHGHHVQHWANGGDTSLGNMVLLCSLHHGRTEDMSDDPLTDADENPSMEGFRAQPSMDGFAVGEVGEVREPRVVYRLSG
jgi:HNH endonuclease